MWQYSPEADEVYFIHKPTDARQWEHPEGQGPETAFYQWLGSQLGSAGFAASASPSPPPFGPSSPPLDFLAPPGAPLSRAMSAPNTGSAADFYNAAPTSYEYADAFSPTSGFPPGPLPGPDGVSDRGLFTHGFGKPAKASGGWSFKLKDFFVGDVSNPSCPSSLKKYNYRPPPPRPPQPLKPSHHALLGPAPGSMSTHAPTFGTFKPPSLNYGRPNSYTQEYLGPEPLITPFPPPPAPAQPASAPSPHPSYQQAFQQSSPYQQPQQPQSNPYQQPGQSFGSSQYQQHHQPARPPTSNSPYQQHQQPAPNTSPSQQLARPPNTFSPTMVALAQQGAPSGYVPSYNSYAPRPPAAGGYVPGRINAGAFKPRPRGEGGDDEDWGPDDQQPVEWAQPVYGQHGSTPPQQQWGPNPGQGQWH